MVKEHNLEPHVVPDNFPVDYQFPIIPSEIDERDYTVNQFPELMLASPGEELPENYEGVSPVIYDQGNTGMCAAFTLSSIKSIQEKKERGVDIRFSPGFIYAYRSDKGIGGPEIEGMSMRFAVKDLRKHGVVEFDDFPVLGTRVKVTAEFEKVKAQLLPKALGNNIESYLRIDRMDSVGIKKAIMAHGAVAIGMGIYDNFILVTTINGQRGLVPYPDKEKNRYLGGHAMTVVGWKKVDGKLYWRVANSWGVNRGEKGFFYIPSDYPAFMEFWALVDAPPRPHYLEKKVIIRPLSKRKESYYEIDTIKYPYTFKHLPFAMNGTTYIGLREFCELFELEIRWNDAKKEVEVIKSR